MFFKSASLEDAVQAEVHDALGKEPNPTAAQNESVAAASKVRRQVAKVEPRWAIILAAAAVVAVVLIAGLYAGMQADKMPDVKDLQMRNWSTGLLTAFNILLGAVGGVISGEYVARKGA